VNGRWVLLALLKIRQSSIKKSSDTMHLITQKISYGTILKLTELLEESVGRKHRQKRHRIGKTLLHEIFIFLLFCFIPYVLIMTVENIVYLST